jgi:tetratricopeptide (TPR) repeat protein
MEDTKAYEDSILASNKSAIENLRKEKLDHAMFFLNQALLTARSMKDSTTKYNLLSITYNNLGCYFKRLKKPSQALEYFIKACEIARLYDSNIANITCSHLNISKIYSEQGDHEKALRHALKSLFLLRHNFSDKKTLVASLVIAYQTVGIEYQHLNLYSDSLECFEAGMDLSIKHLGRNHEVTKTLKNNLKDIPGKDVRSLSNQSKNRYSHNRGKSAGGPRFGSMVDTQRKSLSSAGGKKNPRLRSQVDIKDTGKSSSVPFEIKKYDVSHRNASLIIQNWWRKLKVLKTKKKKAAITIQKWWRGIRAKKYVEKIKFRNRFNKRHIIRNSKLSQIPNPYKNNPIIYEKDNKTLNNSYKVSRINTKSKDPISNIYAKTSSRKILKKNPSEKTYSKYLPEKVKEKQVINKNTEIKSDVQVHTPDFRVQDKSIDRILEINFKKFDNGVDSALTSKLPRIPEEDISSRDSVPRSSKPKKDSVSFKTPETGRKSSPVLLNNNKSNPSSHKQPLPSQKPPKALNSLKLNTENKAKVPDATYQDNVPLNPTKKNYLIDRRADISFQVQSLIKIQSFVKMVVTRLKYLKTLKSVICIQKHFKGHLIRKLYQAIRDAVIFIQVMYRKHKRKR